MRIGITIVFNGLHHLKHNDWAERMSDTLDGWCICEGPSKLGGSTAWCKQIPNSYVRRNGSVDGTRTYLQALKTSNHYGNVSLSDIALENEPYWWKSKDEMVNRCLEDAKCLIAPGNSNEPHFLWQLDVDEQWTPEQMDTAEQELIASGGSCGCFHADHYVGEHLLARGTWGEGNDPVDPLRNAYRRLWLWDGRKFATHEPPVLEGGNGKEVLLLQKPDQPASVGPRFAHYAYFYEKDVAFKEQFYSGHEGLLSRWRALQARPKEDFPRPLSDLITGPWGKTKTEVVWH